MDTLEFRLLNEFQRVFPLCRRPYRAIGRMLGAPEDEVICILRALHARGALSRVGATIVPGRLGAATLAALAVPPQRLVEVAAIASAYPEVNHNYEREHRHSLWFVVAAPTEGRVQEVVGEIEQRSQCGPALNLSMVRAFHVDLGFDLRGHAAGAVRGPEPGGRYAPSPEEAAALAALQDGLAIAPQPYRELAARAGLSEQRVIAVLARLLRKRVIRRLGVIVSHRHVGYCANAMAVWSVPEDAAREAGTRLAAQPGVSLCYQRRRALPQWPYNLYCMLHGTDREAVSGRAAQITLAGGLGGCPRTLLFSRQRFKQCAARYVAQEAHGRDRPAYRESVAG